ncbi:variable surface lipoprotein [Mycoplasmopsis agalactiae]|uniref:variable surface lipoprotein n=1 Tax=Mycoplasmopsis agalactiae TaxID=2110 RepID=UPI001F199F1B|nr:variable surface lipoprotein [Mycoplasmopsis agalactiae]
MKRKLMLIGGLALASSFPMIAASCDSKTIKSEAPEKDVKEPVKTKEIKTETEQPKAKSEIAKAAKENKENEKNLESAGSSNSDSSATPSVPVATEVAKKVENLDDDLEGIRAVEKALRSNLVPRAKQYDIDLTNSWLNSLRGK